MQVVALGVGVGQIMLLFYKPLVGLYLPHGAENYEEVLAAAKTIMSIMLSSYFIGAMSDTLSGFLRGLGYSVFPMLISIGGICAFRLFWITVVFPGINELWGLYLVYPISWTLTCIGLVAVILCVWGKVKKSLQKMQKEQV